MLEKINQRQLEELEKFRLTLNNLWALELMIQGKSVEREIEVRGLMRKGLATQGGITESGREFYQMIVNSRDVDEVKGKVRRQRQKMDDEFSRIWEAYPRNSTHTTNGHYFQGTRVLRKNEDKCRNIYYTKIAEQYDVEDILRALAYEVHDKTTGSIKTLTKTENKLEFMQTLETWLNQKTFEAYLGMEINGEKDENDTIETDGLF